MRALLRNLVFVLAVSGCLALTAEPVSAQLITVRFGSPYYRPAYAYYGPGYSYYRPGFSYYSYSRPAYSYYYAPAPGGYVYSSAYSPSYVGYYYSPPTASYYVPSYPSYYPYTWYRY